MYICKLVECALDISMSTVSCYFHYCYLYTFFHASYSVMSFGDYLLLRQLVQIQ